MNNMWTAFRMCLSMFTSLPLPRCKWEDGLRRHSTACLPLVGLVLGLIWWVLAALAEKLLPGLLTAAVIAALPFLLTGFIHLDGFMDTSDAMLSWRNLEERLRILKDVHVGSFSVVMLVLLAMFQFASAAEIQPGFALALVPVLSRCGSAYCVLRLKPLGHSEYANGENVPEELLKFIKLIAVLALAALVLFGGWRGLLCGAAVLGSYALCMRWCVKTLGGVSGDLAGFSLTVSELAGLIALAVF